MTDADLPDLHQLIACPDSSDRIVRTAHQKQADVILLNLALEIIKIDVVAVVLPQVEIAADHISPVLQNHLAERIVDGLLNKDVIAFPCIGSDRHRQSEHNTRRLD